jgi:hypothetical protein
MPGGNWDFNQTLDPNTGQVKWPTGPLTLETATEQPTWVEAWVVQRTADGTTGASQSYYQSSGWVTGRWTANKLRWKEGDLRVGPALGIALVSSHDTATSPPTPHYYWWVDQINLRP